MTIEKFAFSPEKTYIEVELSDVDNIDEIFLLDMNHRTKATGFNLISKIDELRENSASEFKFNITLSDLNISKFSGLYVLYIYTDLGQVFRDTLLELTHYEECILERILSLTVCDDCLKKKELSTINSFNLLESLKIAEKLNQFEDAFMISDALDKYCSEDCRECGNY